MSKEIILNSLINYKNSGNKDIIGFILTMPKEYQDMATTLIATAPELSGVLEEYIQIKNKEVLSYVEPSLNMIKYKKYKQKYLNLKRQYNL
jgi:hypothetical protein